MNFSVLRKAIQNAEEKAFYDIALLYLKSLGYGDLSIVDGTGDGGRDVTTGGRSDLRIQLSVRKDWEQKLNEEAAIAAKAGSNHLIYVTNRQIRERDWYDFLDKKFKFRGKVDPSIHDLNRVATALSRPSAAKYAYDLLGLRVPAQIEATPKEIAISTMLLFSDEAKELRETVIQAYVKAWILKNPDRDETTLVDQVKQMLKRTISEKDIRSAVSRLRTRTEILGSAKAVRLSDDSLAAMRAAETEFVVAKDQDVSNIVSAVGITREKASILLDMALELLVRQKDLDGAGPQQEEVRKFLADNRLRDRDAVYHVLSKASCAHVLQYGKAVDAMLNANTFDIYRALGRRTDIKMVLDASVAMPLMLGVEFGSSKSRYGLSAMRLRDACGAHGIPMTVPRVYVNEMAMHGLNALRFLDVYGSLPREARTLLRSSGNAYLSHFTHIAESLEAQGEKIELREFLAHFGVVAGRPLQKVENKITTILDSQGIKLLPADRYAPEIRDRIAREKINDAKVIVDHDAIVCTMMLDNIEEGYILATWDSVLIDAVEDVARVLADNPARVIDFLSMAAGAENEESQSIELLTSLMFIDERAANNLAAKIEKIETTEQAFRLQKFIDEARKGTGKSGPMEAGEIADFFKAEFQSMPPAGSDPEV